MNESLCHCGRPLHYVDDGLRAIMLDLVEELGEYVPVTAGNRTWLVQRHYIALHGIDAEALPRLGFREVRQ